MQSHQQSSYKPRRTSCLFSNTFGNGVENPARLMEVSFRESGCSIAKMSYSLPRGFHSRFSILLLTQILFPDGRKRDVQAALWRWPSLCCVPKPGPGFCTALRLPSLRDVNSDTGGCEAPQSLQRGGSFQKEQPNNPRKSASISKTTKEG